MKFYIFHIYDNFFSLPFWVFHAQSCPKLLIPMFFIWKGRFLKFLMIFWPGIYFPGLLIGFGSEGFINWWKYIFSRTRVKHRGRNEIFLIRVYKTSWGLIGFMSDCSGLSFCSSSLWSSNLFDHDIDFVSVFHVQFLGSLSFMKSFTIEEESDVVDTELK